MFLFILTDEITIKKEKEKPTQLRKREIKEILMEVIIEIILFDPSKEAVIMPEMLL